MLNQCELLEKCGFFLHFKGNSEVIKKGWTKSYCESKDKSEKCRRKEIRRSTGKPPVDNMAPTGTML